MKQTPFHHYYTSRMLEAIPNKEGDTSLMELRTREQLKIHCGKKHFEALENG